jgi:hypothetical protein
MKFRTRRAGLALVISSALLAGGTVAMVSPAGAALGDDWQQIWKHEIKPRADKRYYTKKQVGTTFISQAQLTTTLGGYETKAAHDASLGGYETKAAHDASLAGYYTKAQSDAALANYYTKTQGDARYAPYPAVVRGSYIDLNPSGAEIDSPIWYGVTLAVAPAVHYIQVGDPIPAGCAGNATLPDALPGHLCVFETGSFNLGTRGVATPAGSAGSSGTSGAYVYGQPAAAGQFWFRGTWALRPTALAPFAAPKHVDGAVNEGTDSGQLTQ